MSLGEQVAFAQAENVLSVPPPLPPTPLPQGGWCVWSSPIVKSECRRVKWPGCVLVCSGEDPECGWGGCGSGGGRCRWMSAPQLGCNGASPHSHLLLPLQTNQWDLGERNKSASGVLFSFFFFHLQEVPPSPPLPPLLSPSSSAEGNPSPGGRRRVGEGEAGSSVCVRVRGER